MTCSRPQRTVTRPGLEPGTPWSVVRNANHCASPPLLLTRYTTECIVTHIMSLTSNKYLANNVCDIADLNNMSLVVRNPAFCICENKDADQLRGNREADQRLCFRYTDSTIRLLPTSEISSLYPTSVTAQPDLCGTWSETPKTGFLTTRLI